MTGVWGYVVAGILAGAVGAGELSSRYRDDPGTSVLQVAALLYVGVNAVAAMGALYIVRTLGWSFGTPRGSQRDLLQVMVSGLGALTLFRTKLFTASFKDDAHAWGPSRLLEQLLGLADRQMDRRQAAERSRTASSAMADVSFEKAQSLLPSHAIALLEGVTDEDQERLAADVAALQADQTLSDEAKAQLLGIAVIRLTGCELFENSIRDLGPLIRR